MTLDPKLHRTDRLAGLAQHFTARVTTALEACAARGVVLRITYGARSPHAQARLWRRSRTADEVRGGIASLRARGAPWLASVLEDVGPQPEGLWATNALPGLSWHQHLTVGAVDVAWMVDGPDPDTLIDDASWDTSPSSGYRVWREEAVRAGLFRGPERDWAHMQGDAAPAPAYRWPTLDAMMREQWGDPKKWPAGAK